jgi:ribosomal protein S18 acetylase RimI-like enzyme
MEARLATKKDLKAFIPIKQEFLKSYGIGKKTAGFIEKEFNDYLKHAIILAIEDNAIIGYLAGEIETNSYEKTGYISEVFVLPAFRGKGISTRLKDKFLEFLRSKKISICRIDVNPSNPAREVYKSWGFKVDKYRMSLNID